MDALYRGYPVGSLLTWQTSTEGIDFKGNTPLQPGSVQLGMSSHSGPTVRIVSLVGARAETCSICHLKEPCLLETTSRVIECDRTPKHGRGWRQVLGTGLFRALIPDRV